MTGQVATRNWLDAAEGILADFDRACKEPRPDWQSWANRLAGTLTQVTARARETQARNKNMVEIFEKLLAEHKLHEEMPS